METKTIECAVDNNMQKIVVVFPDVPATLPKLLDLPAGVQNRRVVPPPERIPDLR